jgi:hypothetical protein
MREYRPYSRHVVAEQMVGVPQSERYLMLARSRIAPPSS